MSVHSEHNSELFWTTRTHLKLKIEQLKVETRNSTSELSLEVPEFIGILMRKWEKVKGEDIFTALVQGGPGLAYQK